MGIVEMKSSAETNKAINIEEIICNDEEKIDVDIDEIILDGKTVEKHVMEDGVRNGESIYYKDGIISQRVMYKDGKINGPVEIYKNGSLNLIMHYKDEKPNGAMYVFENGILTQLGMYKNGEKHGAFFVFKDEYLIDETSYKKGLLNGRRITYYPKSSDIFEIGQYENDVKVGSWKQFDNEGNIIKEEKY